MTKIFHPRALVVVAALAVLATAAPAFAETVYVTDAAGDTPDIRRLTLDNRQSTVVLKQKYADLDFVQVESLYIKWGDATHYRVNIGNYDADDALEKRLWLVTADGEDRKACGDLMFEHDADEDRTTVRVPRSCIPRAPNRIRAKGVASMGLYENDQTSLTPYASRG